jgi:hypothetical protein
MTARTFQSIFYSFVAISDEFIDAVGAFILMPINPVVCTTGFLVIKL